MRKRRSRRRKLPAYFWAVPAAAVTFVVLCFYLFPHKHPASKISPPIAVSVDRSEIIRAFRSALDRAGGEDAWVEPIAGADQHVSRTASDPFKVWATAAGYERVVDSAESEARRNHLTFRVEGLADEPALRAERIELTLRDAPLFQFKLREIPRIMRVAIIVDDLGQNLAAAQALSRIQSSITFSVMPHLRYSRETAATAHRAGREVMLHLPMQPILDSAPDVSRDELRVGMKSREVSEIIDNDLNSLPFVIGVNNHMGSRATTDAQLMRDVMTVLAARHLYFVDSLTTRHSVALRVARECNVSSFYRSVFLDNTRSIPYTLSQLHTLRRIAEKKGSALAIGHPYPTTIEALAQYLPQLESQGIQLVPASRLVR